MKCEFFPSKVDKQQFEKILSYIEIGKKEGATLLTGGKALNSKGYYIEPTIFINVRVNILLSFYPSQNSSILQLTYFSFSSHINFNI